MNQNKVVAENSGCFRRFFSVVSKKVDVKDVIDFKNIIKIMKIVGK